MGSGDTTARSDDITTMTYNTASVRGRLRSGRVSFACLDSSGSMPEQNYLVRTDCSQGMRAQIQFQSCWDGRNFQSDNSHVACMSQIDNGVCPPTHPWLLLHLFLEVLYGVNDIQKIAGGKFVFSNGDTTGLGFHGDFMDGWDTTTLASVVTQVTNCPERLSLVDEAVYGFLDKLPGCNDVPSGLARAPQSVCATQTCETCCASKLKTESVRSSHWQQTIRVFVVGTCWLCRR